ncbi:hypothetical protein MNAB215_2800 [Mycobacterium numidiamassiliense]|uniref:Uncharacterized protein n=1 Tax=Mycobacterium numidiamassiliense TaxID=1841861 RepID=A0A2U3PA12_9MYCO|nr:hypothetical protein [Mycobacterium numidiamassiliense]SPM40599.1 hypothetical protein MNAB215_2800 [Mycobacterium numidiamassiliense]
MEDTWTNRDLPVLRAAVEIFDDTQASKVRASQIAKAAEFDDETTQRALRALYRQPYFQEGTESSGSGFIFVGEPTGEALRLAGQWPTPENMVERLVAALEAAGDEESRDAPEQSRFKQAAALLRTGAFQVAVSALGGAGGHMLYG